jgi:hypothetical protein
MQHQQIFSGLPPAVLRAYAAISRQMAKTAQTKEVVPGLLELADRLEVMAARLASPGLAEEQWTNPARAAPDPAHASVRV